MAVWMINASCGLQDLNQLVMLFREFWRKYALEGILGCMYACLLLSLCALPTDAFLVKKWRSKTSLDSGMTDIGGCGYSTNMWSGRLTTPQICCFFLRKQKNINFSGGVHRNIVEIIILLQTFYQTTVSLAH